MKKQARYLGLLMGLTTAMIWALMPAPAAQAEAPFPQPGLDSGIPVRLCEDVAPYGDCDTVLVDTETDAIYYPALQWTLPGAFQLDLTGIIWNPDKRYVLEYGAIEVIDGDSPTGYAYAGLWDDDPLNYLSTSAYSGVLNTITGNSYAAQPINGKDVTFASGEPILIAGSDIVFDFGLGGGFLSSQAELGGQIWGYQY